MNTKLTSVDAVAHPIDQTHSETDMPRNPDTPGAWARHLRKQRKLHRKERKTRPDPAATQAAAELADVLGVTEQKTANVKARLGSSGGKLTAWEGSLIPPDAVEANTRNQKATHSPLPWSIDPEGQYTITIEARGKEAVQLNGTDEITQANAAFIVRAVNNVEALAEALKGMIQQPNWIVARTNAIEALAKYEADKQ